MNTWFLFILGSVFGFIAALLFRARVSETEYEAKLRADYCYEQLKARERYIAELEGQRRGEPPAPRAG